MAGCGNASAEYEKAFGESSLVTGFEVDSDFAVTGIECEVSKDGGIEQVFISATLENDSYKVQMQAIGGKDDSGERYFTVTEEPVVTAKKGIDFLDGSGQQLADDAAYAVTFDEQAQTCTVEISGANKAENALVTVSDFGTVELTCNNGQWKIAGESMSMDIVYKTEAIEGTYAPNDASAPEVIISNVREEDEGWVFDIAYTFDGVNGDPFRVFIDDIVYARK